MPVENPTNPMAAAASISDSRPRLRFPIPDVERVFPGDPKEVVMRPITLAEEKRASTSATNTGTDFGIEAIKHALVTVDGQPLGWDNGAKEKFLDGLSPRVRQLLVRAYEKIHIPPKEVVEDFLAHMEVVV